MPVIYFLLERGIIGRIQSNNRQSLLAYNRTAKKKTRKPKEIFLIIKLRKALFHLIIPRFYGIMELIQSRKAKLHKNNDNAITGSADYWLDQKQ